MWRRCGSGTWVAVRQGIVGFASTKPVEIAAPKSSLTPCILDDHPAQLEMLLAVIAGMGYEAISTSNPGEALKLVERGQCRLVLVGSVRELENAISSACIKATGDFIDLADLPEQLQHRSRAWKATIGSRCRSKRGKSCTSGACWGCARATG